MVTAAEAQRCPDCDSEIALWQDENEMRHVSVCHDDNCVQLAFRKRHGATTGAIVVADPGQTVPADLVAEVATVIGQGSDRVRISFGDHPEFDRTEREVFEDES
jgi:hypothetical protein